jgi:hypothetical protein
MIKYYNRSPFPVYVALCTDQKSFNKELKKLKWKEPCLLVDDNCKAIMHTFTLSNKSPIYIIGFDLKRAKKEKWQLSKILATLIHEIIHVWQFTMEYAEEKNPGKEVEAYWVGHLSEEIFIDILKLLEISNKIN